VPEPFYLNFPKGLITMSTVGTPAVITGSTPVLVGSTVSTPPIALMVSATGANNSGGVAVELATGGPSLNANALRVDGFANDLSKDGFAANGNLVAVLQASSPITIDMTSPYSAQAAATSFSQAGDVLATALNRLYINNYGSAPVILSVGATNALTGVPTFTIPAGSKQRLDFGSTGLPVSGTVKTIKLDPSTGTPTVALAYGGA
jgi:hypothetical protein